MNPTHLVSNISDTVNWYMIARCIRNMCRDDISLMWHQPCNEQTALYHHFEKKRGFHTDEQKQNKNKPNKQTADVTDIQTMQVVRKTKHRQSWRLTRSLGTTPVEVRFKTGIATILTNVGKQQLKND